MRRGQPFYSFSEGPEGKVSERACLNLGVSEDCSVRRTVRPTVLTGIRHNILKFNFLSSDCLPKLYFA